MLGTNIFTLDSADDAALLDKDIGVATERVTAIARGSETNADMKINIEKAKVMHVARQGAVTATERGSKTDLQVLVQTCWLHARVR